MERQDVVTKHWESVEETAENAVISIEKYLRGNNSTPQFDDKLKQYLLCQIQNG